MDFLCFHCFLVVKASDIVWCFSDTRLCRVIGLLKETSSCNRKLLVVLFNTDLGKYVSLSSRFPDEEAGQIPMAYSVRKPNATATADDIMKWVSKQVSEDLTFSIMF